MMNMALDCSLENAMSYPITYLVAARPPYIFIICCGYRLPLLSSLREFYLFYVLPKLITKLLLPKLSETVVSRPYDRWRERTSGQVFRPGPFWDVVTRLVISCLVIENQIMAASAIIISSDSSDESVGSPPSRVILFGDIPTVIPSTSVLHLCILLCGLVPYTGSDSDSPDEMTSPEHISPLPAVSPFICTDSSDGPPLQDPYVATVARWRSRRLFSRPGEAIPFGRPYRTHLNGPRKLLTARKRVGPLPARRLASRHASPRSPDHHSSSSSSSSDSLPVHSLGLDAPDQAHSGSSTRDVSPRLCYPPRRAPRCSEAFRRWCAAPLSTWYPPTTSESSQGGSPERPMHLSSHSAGPSRKRCRSPVDSDIIHASYGILVLTRADLSPPRKSAGDTDEVGIDPMTAPLVEEEIVEPAGEDSPDSSGTRDGIVRVVGGDQLIASGDRARMAEMIYSLRLENLKVRAMLDIERDRVSSLRLHMSLSQEEFRQIRRDRDDARGRLRRLESYLGRRFGFRP
ncbi:hypothetical protein Tco_0415514 [Tanacetum coccineum]